MVPAFCAIARGIWSRAWATAVLAVAACLWAAVVITLDAQADEQVLKAAVVSKLPQFTVWPAETLTGRNEFELCVEQATPIATALTELVEGEMLEGRPMVVREIGRAIVPETCHVLVVSTSSAARRRALLASATVRPILTVGDADSFLDEGGIIRLRMSEGRVRFDISRHQADRVKLSFSSQLLRLASSVREGPA